MIKVSSNHPTALLAAARTQHKLENYGLVRDFYERQKEVDPQLANRFAFLDFAASIAGVQDVILREEGNQ